VDRVERTALVSVVINVGLVFLKVFLAVLSGSLALLADAWHSGSDVVASGLVWAGARISRRGGKGNLALVENVVALTISILILWAAVGIFRRVSAATSAPITNLAVAIGGSLVAALVSYYAAQYKLYVGKETGSLSLIADGHHSRMDTLTTGAVVVGLMGHAIGIQLDRIAAVIVALFVVESGVMILLAAAGGLREGTAAKTTPIQRFTSSAPVRFLLAALETAGIGNVGRVVRRAATDPERRRVLVAAVVAIVVAVWLLTGIYFVGPAQVGVLRRWGRALDSVASPGAHLKAPWPIDRVVRVEAALVRRVEIGFRTREAPRAITEVAAEFYATLWESRHAAGTYEKLPDEALRLTGDENIVDMNIVVLYRVSDPYAYLLNVAAAEDLVRFTTESVVTAVAGSLAIEDVLTIERGRLEDTLASAVQSFLADAQAGVEIVGIKLQDMHPPLEVVPSFRDVSSAREDKDRIINDAYGYANETVPTARGDAERLLREAEGYRSDRIARARGDADRLIAMAAQYRRAKRVTEDRLYLETMEELLRGIDKYIVSSKLDLKGYDIHVFDRTLGSGTGVENQP
jgi:membrane protease subunit HflK